MKKIKLFFIINILIQSIYAQDILTARSQGIGANVTVTGVVTNGCLLYTSPSPRDVEESRMPSYA